MNRANITNSWFFTEANSLFKFFMIYVNGDIIVLLPLLIAIAFIGFFSIKFMLLIFGLYVGLRGFIEMIYWLLQQFGDRKYRPYDYGFKNLDNNAIYIIYQTRCLVHTIQGFALMLFAGIYL